MLNFVHRGERRSRDSCVQRANARQI